MAGYRQFHTKFWKDEWLIDLEPMERYLFSYLFTNELSSISGLYKLPLKVIINETGLQPNFINKALAKFQVAKKIFYKDGVIWVVNMKNHHKNASPLTMKKVNNDIDEIGDCAVKRAYLYHEETGKYSIDTISILNSESVSVSENLTKDKDKDLPAKKPAGNLFQIARALSSVTGLDYEKNQPRIYKAAKSFKPGEEQQIIREYGLGGLWYKNDWRGQKNQKPTLEQVIQTWNNLNTLIPEKKTELSQFEKNKLVAEEFIQEVQNGEV
jgi:hypothetical protein